MADKPYKKEQILDIIRTKAVMKQDVCQLSNRHFAELKEVVRKICNELKEPVNEIDKRIEIEFRDRGPYHCEMVVGGDVLIFHIHTNVFKLDPDHSLWKSSYLMDEPFNAYCGIIQVYNFLADSFRFNRDNDTGYLIARIFINREGHFYVQGKDHLGVLFNDFINQEFDLEQKREVVKALLMFSLDFDLLTPPYRSVQEATARQMRELGINLRLKTGKRLGFQFISGEKEID